MAKKQQVVQQREKRIAKLRAKRDVLWRSFCRMPRRESFSGLHVAQQLEKVQQELNKLEGKNRSKRYYPEITIEIPCGL